MSPDDPRHGDMKGWAAGCKDICCRRAKARYEKHRRYNAVAGIRWAIPALGTQRRIQALMAIGWTTTDIAHAAGWSHRNRVRQIIGGQKGKPTTWVTRSTFTTIANIYDDLSMTVPELNPVRRRSRTLALKLGYVPPLAWDDIDMDFCPVDKPTNDSHDATDQAKKVDPVVVLRVLNGDKMDANPAERQEIVRRWTQAGRPLAELARLTGWKPERYGVSA